MKKNFTSFLFFLYAPLIFSQPKIKFEKEVYKLGYIIQGTPITEKLKFTNTGTVPITIEKAGTSDGGSYADFLRDTVFPGQSSFIIFHQITEGRIGTFSKAVYVSISNKVYDKQYYLTVSGEVIWPPTVIKVDSKEKNIGRLDYFDVDTVQFKVVNTGPKQLHIGFDNSAYTEGDLWACRIMPTDTLNYRDRDNISNIKDTITVRIILKNIYGNVGKFERRLLFKYNSCDSLILTVKGEYYGQPYKNNLFDGNSILYYKAGKLYRKSSFDWRGNIQSEDLFEGPHCIYSKRYSWERTISEFFYRNGDPIKK